MEKEIVISVVLPFFNGKEFIQETLESIRGQTFSQFEVVVVDDGSTLKEHSEYLTSLIKSLCDPRFRYMYKENGGLSDARNYGIRKSSGSWIAFIDQDDIWDSTKLERQIAVVNEHKVVNFIFTDARFIGDVEGAMGVARKNSLKEGVVAKSYEKILKGNFVTCSSIMFRKSLISKVGYSSPTFKICPDYEFIIRFSEQTDFYFINAILVSYRIHGANTVKNELKGAAEVILLLVDRRIDTKMGKLMATYNLATQMFALCRNWTKKLYAQ